MCERARRSRDSSSRYSIDTLFPGLSSNLSGSRSGEPVLQKSGSGMTPTPAPPASRKGSSKSGSGIPRESVRDNGVHPSCPGAGTKLPRGSSAANGQTGTTGRSKGAKGSATTTTTPRGPSGPATKRRASSPLKPTTQPKQISLLSSTKMSRKGMQEVFQPWVLQTYGDSAKTKTITRKKYGRVQKTLLGEEVNNAENSKFRFWVKAKGFMVGPPPGHPRDEVYTSNEHELFVPATVKDASGNEQQIYKRVAVVEQFFDIIYNVHVDTEAKNGKHAGQKRTYRAITEKYAFLPREAVTKFLLQCMECQKRGSPGADTGLLNGKLLLDAAVVSPESSPSSPEIHHPPPRPSTPTPPPIKSNSHRFSELVKHKACSASSYDIDFSLPFTTTYMRRQKKESNRRRNGFHHEPDYDDDDEESRMSDPSSLEDEHDHVVEPKRKSKGSSGESRRSALESQNPEIPTPVDWLGYHPIGLKKERLTPTSSTTTCSNNNNNNSIYTNGKHEFREQSSPLSLSDRSGVGHEIGQDETSSNGNKEDEDDDDDESEDKMDLTQAHDPERLKSFNMFVRLFVDENLDRMVPISKQPKEKIQAIIDSCTRQFPEFAERARKRIRTYLKSCRRNKRCRDTGGWESSRPTPAHLTSVQAEQILAQACENESQNAKRMRMGLEPIGQPLPASASGGRASTEAVGNGNGHKENSELGTSSSSSATSSPEKASKSAAAVVTAPLAAIITSSASALVGNGLVSGNLSSAATPTSSSSDGLGNHHLGISGSAHLLSSGGRSPSTLDNQAPAVVSSVAKPTAERSHLLDYSRTLNGNGVTNMSMYRPNFCQAFTRPIPMSSLFPPTTSAVTTTPSGGLGLSGLESFNGINGGGRAYNSSHNSISPLMPIVTNGGDIGPTDLSMKGSKPLVAHKLNSTEMTTVRTLITGYRESAAFLLRSADELEQLLVQQN